jgi:hypothetical protein
MPTIFSRSVAVLGGVASAVVLKWAFDYWLWDFSFQRLALMLDFDKAEAITAVLSYLVPLASAALAHAALSPHPPEDDSPALRKPPWQSPRLIVGVLIIIAAMIAGPSLGRFFGLPSITLPQYR